MREWIKSFTRWILAMEATGHVLWHYHFRMNKTER